MTVSKLEYSKTSSNTCIFDDCIEIEIFDDMFEYFDDIIEIEMADSNICHRIYSMTSSNIFMFKYFDDIIEIEMAD